MRLWHFSDLHQEFNNPWNPLDHAPEQGFDVVVASGDIANPLTAGLEWLHERLPGVRTVYTPGNHEFYWDGNDDRYTIYDQIERGRDLAARYDIDLLIDSATIIDGVRFVGGVLWTDMRTGSWSRDHAFNTSRRGMNDYKRIRRKQGKHRQLRPVDTLSMHQATRAFIAQTLADPHEGPNVVVTHHAPHPNSLRDQNEDLRWCYASDMTELIEQSDPDLWLHGHIHRPVDYMIGSTRIRSNPRGYPGEDTGFNDQSVVEV